MTDSDYKSMSYEQLVKLAEDIELGRDRISLSRDLVDDPDAKPTMQQRMTLQQRIQAMTTGERLKLAMRGNREARALLIRDSSLMIRRYVLANPRISEEEIVMLARNRQIDRELLDTICRNNEWLNNYQVRLAVVKNPKTPVPVALKHIHSLLMRDLRQMAKSKNIPIAINSAAKRIVLRGGQGQGG